MKKPKPRFRVGQVVFCKNINHYGKVVGSYGTVRNGKAWTITGFEDDTTNSFYQKDLRPLTARERGASRGKTDGR